MVSVVIPLYNVERYVERCLKSVLAQSYKDVEIVIVDDASTDHSLRIAEHFQDAHSNIRILRHERNLGLMSTRRDGYMSASGDFILFLDADDALPIDAVKTLVEKQAETEADIVMGNLKKYYPNGRTERRVGSYDQGHAATSTTILAALIGRKIIHSLCGKLFKTSLFCHGELLTYAHLTIAEDACLLYQLVARAHTIASIDAIVYAYYVHKTSTSLRAYTPIQIDNIVQAYKTIKDICKSYPQLQDLLNRRLTQVMFTLYFERVPLTTVRALLRKYGLIRYGSIAYACKYLSLKDYWYCVKRYVYVRTMMKK